MKKNLVIIFLISICLILFLKGCHKQSYIDDLQNQFDLKSHFANILNNQIREQITKNGTLIAKIDVLELQNGDLQEKIKNKDFKKITSSVQFLTKTIHDTIVMYRKDTILIHNGVEKQVAYFEEKNNWITLQGYLDSNKVEIDTLIIVNDFDVQLGTEKDGWFKKKNVVLIESKNPYTRFTRIEPFVFSEQKKWHEKDGWKIALTAIVTSIILLK